MFALQSRVLRRRLSAPTSGSARRRAWERARAKQTRAEGERLARERREQRAREKVEQQRQALKELASYEPWGRAGGGAPNPHGVRFSDLRATGIYPEDELKGVTQYEVCQRWRSPRRHRRTPIRLHEDPETCYAENLRRTVDNDIRYKQTPDQQRNYKQILDDMVDKRKKAIKNELKRNLEYERKMHTMAGPWGKPGPGGTIWRDPRNIGLNFSNSMARRAARRAAWRAARHAARPGPADIQAVHTHAVVSVSARMASSEDLGVVAAGWTDNDGFNKLKRDHRRYKRSSLTLPQVKRDDDSREEPPGEDLNKSNNNNKLPEIKNTNSSNEDSKNGTRKNNITDDGKKVKESNGEKKVKRKSPNKSNYVKRLSNGDRLKRMIPDENADDCEVNSRSVVFEENKPTPEATILRLTGGVELVPLLARRRREGARTLPSSDVTRPPEQSCEWRELLNVDYLRELQNQIHVKYKQKEERRRDSAESVKQHHETWASLWGRPGHGAPLPRGRYARSNLAQLLYVEPLSNAL